MLRLMWTDRPQGNSSLKALLRTQFKATQTLKLRLIKNTRVKRKNLRGSEKVEVDALAEESLNREEEKGKNRRELIESNHLGRKKMREKVDKGKQKMKKEVSLVKKIRGNMVLLMLTGLQQVNLSLKDLLKILLRNFQMLKLR